MNKLTFKFIFYLLIFLAVCWLVIWYVDTHTIAVLDPKGIIALQERDLIIIATILMLFVVLPVFVLLIGIALRYRAGNKDAKFTPEWDYNLLMESIWWGLPCVIIFALSIITFTSSYDLDPFKPLKVKGDPLKIQVVALQWKWLFIYPDQNIATVNFVQFPKDRPINFEVTADAPMNSFWIPQLAGQIYAMPGMKTKLHLIANEVGNYRGSSANISGAGFASMTFIAKASTQEEFDEWLKSVQQSSQSLDLSQYRKLVEPSEYHPVENFNLKKQDLFDWIIMSYMMPMQTAG